MTYTVKLIALKCNVSQEDDGDEIYLTLNGQRVWSVPRDYTLHEHPRHPHQIKAVDFVTGRCLTSEGWRSMPEFAAGDFIFNGQTGWSQFEVWDHDNFTRDDYFGAIGFSENEAGRGEITGVAAHDAVHYVLTYEVVADAQG